MRVLMYIFLLITVSSCLYQIRQSTDHSINIKSNYVEFDNGYGVYQIPYQDSLGILDTLFAYTEESLDYLYAPLLDSVSTYTESMFTNGFHVKLSATGDSLQIEVIKDGISTVIEKY